MKSKLSMFALLVIVGCSGHEMIQSGAAKPPEAMALGWVDRTVLEQPQFSQFKTVYDTVQVNRTMVAFIRQASDSVQWIVFFGTWCGDSKRQVPMFLKVADSAGIPRERIKLYGLDRSLKDDKGLAEKYRVRSVPTFIFLKDGKEIGRITETPTIGMEADMLTIMAAAQ